MTTMGHRHIAAATSIALHVALMLVLTAAPPAVRSPDRHADKDVEVRLTQDDGRLRPKPETPADRPPRKRADGTPTTAALSRCDGRLYTGIGVRSWGGGAIIEVASGGPADKAGIVAGDILLNPGVTEPDQHKPGTRITLRIQRGREEMPAMIAVIEEICDEQARPPQRLDARSDQV